MKMLKIIGRRLRRPKIILSLVSQIVTILLLFGCQLDEHMVNGLAARCSMLITLGILCPPNKEENDNENIG